MENPYWVKKTLELQEEAEESRNKKSKKNNAENDDEIKLQASDSH